MTYGPEILSVKSEVPQVKGPQNEGFTLCLKKCTVSWFKNYFIAKNCKPSSETLGHHNLLGGGGCCLDADGCDWGLGGGGRRGGGCGNCLKEDNSQVCHAADSPRTISLSHVTLLDSILSTVELLSQLESVLSGPQLLSQLSLRDLLNPPLSFQRPHRVSARRRRATLEHLDATVGLSTGLISTLLSLRDSEAWGATERRGLALVELSEHTDSLMSTQIPWWSALSYEYSSWCPKQLQSNIKEHWPQAP